jgi:hypothetical protein
MEPFGYYLMGAIITVLMILIVLVVYYAYMKYFKTKSGFYVANSPVEGLHSVAEGILGNRTINSFTDNPTYDPIDQAELEMILPPSKYDQDYSNYLLSLGVDKKVKEGQDEWVGEVKPWSGAVKKIDNIELEADLPFQGLRRVEGVKPTEHDICLSQVTEVAYDDVKDNDGEMWTYT